MMMMMMMMMMIIIISFHFYRIIWVLRGSHSFLISIDQISSISFGTDIGRLLFWTVYAADGFKL